MSISPTAHQGHLSGNSAALTDVNGVAELLTCSSRHVYRLSDAGKMPRPRKVGTLSRWSLQEIQEWIEAGCPSCRKGGAK